MIKHFLNSDKSIAAPVFATVFASILLSSVQANAGEHHVQGGVSDNSWSGAYVGFDAGAGFTADAVSKITSSISPGFVTQLGTGATATMPYFSMSGLAGLHAGFNLQQDQIVYGFETDVQRLFKDANSGNAKTSVAHPVSGLINTTMSGVAYADWLATFRGRLGYVIQPDVVLYGTGGLALGYVKTSGTVFQDLTSFPATAPGIANMTSYGPKLGWTVGIGGEYKIKPNWSAKLEYLYYDLGTTSASSQLNYAKVSTTVGTSTVTQRVTGHMVRFGLSYHF